MAHVLEPLADAFLHGTLKAESYSSTAQGRKATLFKRAQLL